MVLKITKLLAGNAVNDVVFCG